MGRKMLFTAAGLVVALFFCAQANAEPVAKKEGMSQAMSTMSGGGKCPYLAEKESPDMGMADMHHHMMGKDKQMCTRDEGADEAGLAMHKRKGFGMIGGASSMVPSDKGGVIVLVGRHLYKYDSNLNLVKQAEIDVK